MLQATFILKHVTNPKAKRLLNAISPGEPSPKCAACGTARLELHIDTAKTTLDDLLNMVSMEAELSVAPMWAFTIQLFRSDGSIILSGDISLAWQMPSASV